MSFALNRSRKNMENDLLRFDKKSSFVFIDCETFNLCLNFCQNLPWQVSMIKAVNGKKVDEKDLFIKWDTNLKISKEAKRITRYDPVKVQKLSRSFDEVFPIISEWLDSSDYIVGHNILGFDIYLIKEMYLLKNRRIDHLVEKIIDTNCIAKGIKFPVEKLPEEGLMDYQYKLLHTRRKGVKTNQTALGKEYKIEHDYDRLHDAIVDLELNLKIWNKLKYQIDI